MSEAYYNEWDKFAANWLRELIHEGHIAHGHVDERSICDVTKDDLKGYTQCHFFAGIGGWSLALRMAGWPDEREAWTGSCPCQPFSQAGQRKGTKDPRHLWPAFNRLIKSCHPTIVYGEQVASSDALKWLDIVFANLEAQAYATVAFDLPACGAGAPILRQRLFWVAESCGGQRDDVNSPLRSKQRTQLKITGRGSFVPVARSDSARRPCAGRICKGDNAEASGNVWYSKPEHLSKTLHPWRGAGVVKLRDGTKRPTEPGSYPLALRLPDSVGSLRGYGNAISPQIASMFVRAYMESA